VLERFFLLSSWCGSRCTAMTQACRVVGSRNVSPSILLFRGYRLLRPTAFCGVTLCNGVKRVKIYLDVAMLKRKWHAFQVSITSARGSARLTDTRRLARQALWQETSRQLHKLQSTTARWLFSTFHAAFGPVQRFNQAFECCHLLWSLPSPWTEPKGQSA
jgi:hypothetical protein